MRIRHLLPLTALASALLLAGCGGDQDTGQPLAFAPADTPWLLANAEPMPAAAMDAWWKNAQQMAPFYERALESAVADIERKEPDATATKALRAVRDELRGKYSQEGWKSLGFTNEARSAIYGIGLVPVLRMELGDPAAFRAFVGRVEAKSGASLATGEVAGQAFWKIGGDDGKAMIVAAIQDKHLVLTIAPAQPSEALLRSLLGLDRPASSALDAGVLAKFDEERGYLPYGSGWIDSQRLAALLTGERSPIEKEFLGALGVEPGDTTLSPACKTEFAALAAAMPRLSFGYRAMDAKSMDIHYALEVAPEHGKALAALAADVPGLDGRGEGMLDVGFGLDLDAFAGFVNARAAKVAEKPFACEALVPLNEDIAKANSELANPAVFMAGAALSGIYASLSQFELGEGVPVFKGKVALGSDNPLSLLQMAGGFMPQLATLDLKPGASPVSLPAGMLPPTLPPAHVAVSDKALALSIGEGEETTLAAFAAAAPGKPAPLLHYGFDSRGMTVFIDSMRKGAQTALAEAEAQAAMEAGSTSDDPTQDDGASAEREAGLTQLREAVATFDSMQTGYANVLERLDFAVYATERGIEANYVLELK
jgi:hypothetical protein